MPFSSRRPRSELREQQQIIHGLQMEHDAALIVSAMGSGKTGATLTALRDHLDMFESHHVLVVAPLRVARDTWPEEIKTWAHTAGLSFSACVGSPKERKDALLARAEITIINRENLPWLWEELGQGKGWFFDTVIVDESSMFKDGKKRTKLRKLTRFGVLCAARKHIRRIYLLTGTVAPNGLHDLWGQLYLLDQGKRLGTSKTAFMARWFDVDTYTYKITPKPNAEREIMDLISDIVFTLPALELVPPPVHIPVYVDLPKKVMDEYRRFARTLVTEKYDVEAVTKGVLANKLLQFANGSLYNEDREVVPVHDEKLRALDDLIEQAAGEPVLIFYGFLFDLQAIRKRYPDAVVLNEDDDAVAKWNRGEIKILLAHPASCAHGLNMQYGGHICIWYGLTWSLELYLQANARLPRPGQKHVVAIYHIIARGTYDERAMLLLEGKEATQDRINAATMEWLQALDG